MKHTTLLYALLMVAVPLVGHDMFLVMEDHHLPEFSEVKVSLYNGTFDKSENSIDRDRMGDVSLVDGQGEVEHPAERLWSDKDNISVLSLETGESGTYVLGVSTTPRMIELSAAEFNEYLVHDGVLDVLESRKRNGSLEKAANERYSKHVKTILQVGETATDTYSTFLGYPIEIVPQSNPADLEPGDSLKVLVMADGSPASDQLIYASHAEYHTHDATGGHRESVQTRTDDNGVAEIEISQSGRWYIRLIRMVPVTEPGVDYESNWATLTFQVD